MTVGVRLNPQKKFIYSREFNSYWTSYTPRLSNLIDETEYDKGKSDYQDYNPILPTDLHRWNDD